MFGSNMYGQSMYGQGYSNLTQTVMTILHGLTQGVAGFIRFTRRIV